MSKQKKSNKLKTGKLRMILGIVLLFSGFIFTVSFISYLLNWKLDQSAVGVWADNGTVVNNIFGKLGAWLGEFFIYRGIGASAILFSIWLMVIGGLIIIKWKKFPILKFTLNILFFVIWLPLLLSFSLSDTPILGGRMGFELKSYLLNLIDFFGVILVLLISFIIYAVFEWRITPEKINHSLTKEKKIVEESKNTKTKKEKVEKSEIATDSKPQENKEEYKISKGENLRNNDENDDIEFKISTKESSNSTKKTQSAIQENNNQENKPEKIDSNEPKITEVYIEPHKEGEVALTVETHKEEEIKTDGTVAETLVEKHGEYNPRLDLAKYKFPTIDLLKDYSGSTNTTFDQNELEANKNKIVETLNNYGINISSIKATIGPTVTLYEIVPEAGVRISKIKNLEDDIALSLSALGIRIIAPIPGKGTIGIEVPNNNPTIVSIRSVIGSQKFQASKMELPIAFGKTISNETFIADLAKMPHLLMAGATGQGKSVGINAIISCLLYKKHPSELKFVMVDPKKVELALYNKIERHFLAKLPGSDEAIITDNQKVINTLNSLTVEMDQRYDLLQKAYVRSIKEYNEKFKKRELNPENGHRYLPYIVLIVDEFADLIMTAGKDVEQPIARLAQLARAVGIHLVIATQRPSVNVITGIIKANFPARAAFRVTSKIDSRTILDSSGADQLIGKGDMLYTRGNDLVRLQCAFVDTPEVDRLADFIGSQKGYPDAFLLPEYEGDEGGSALDIDPDERDPLFEDAAYVVVSSQQGSTSMLQRKLKIGYNRAGRIIDQLEANNIVGPFEGNKAREVLITNLESLEQFLKTGEI